VLKGLIEHSDSVAGSHELHNLAADKELVTASSSVSKQHFIEGTEF
jgi:hypothetical protein